MTITRTALVWAAVAAGLTATALPAQALPPATAAKVVARAASEVAAVPYDAGSSYRLLVPGEANGGRRSSDSWGNMNTVEWDRGANVLRAASDPRNPVGKATVAPTR